MFLLIALGVVPLLIRVLFLPWRPVNSIQEGFPLLHCGLQDGVIVLELYLLGGILPFPFFVLISLLAQSYILLDGYFYSRVKDRLGIGYLASLKQCRYFVDSAKKLGFYKFLGLCGLLAIYHISICLWLPQPIFSWGIVVALGSIGIACACWSPQDWRLENALFSLQRSLFRRAKQPLDLSIPFSWETETSVPISPCFPLLRRIDGFRGKRSFDIHLKEGETPHIVFLFLESFRAKEIGCLGGAYEVTPSFDALSKEGFLFRNFYANGVLTSHALLASLYGILPFYVSKEAKHQGLAPGQIAHLKEERFIGIADLLKSRGYLSAYFDNTAIDYEGHATFLKNHGFDVVVGREQIEQRIPQQAISWGGHDEFLLTYWIQWLEEQEKKETPTFSAIFTLSNHHPWTPPPSYQGKDFTSVTSEEYRNYLKTFHYTDQCLGRFLMELKKRHLAEKTIFFILGDHGQDFGEHGNSSILRDLHEENIHIPLLILAPGRISEPKCLNRLGSQIDLMPTLMDLLGLQGICHPMGTSLRREGSSSEAFFTSYLQGFYLGLRKDNEKWMMGARGEEFYDLIQDPQETYPLFFSGIKINRFKTRAEHVFQFVHALYVHHRFAIPEKNLLNYSGNLLLSDQVLSEILENSPPFQTIHLSHCLQLTPKAFFYLAKHASSLLELDLSGCLITEEALETIVLRAKRLETLRLSQCHLLGNRTLDILFWRGKHLKYVDLSEVAELSFPSPIKTKIEWLNLSHCPLDDEKIKLLSLFIPRIKSLTIHCENVQGPGLVFLLQHCPFLQTLDCQGQDVNLLLKQIYFEKKFCKK